MDEGRKSQKKTASSSPHEDSKEVLEKILLLEERVQKLEEKGQVLTHDVARSSKAKLKAIQLGFNTDHTVGFNLMKEYAKKVFPKGKWEEVDRNMVEKAVGPLSE